MDSFGSAQIVYGHEEDKCEPSQRGEMGNLDKGLTKEGKWGVEKLSTKIKIKKKIRATPKVKEKN